MFDFLKRLFSADFMPHGTCYLWDPAVLWLNVVSDASIALAYYAIPFLLFAFVRKRRDIGFRWIFVAFALFILACGTTHLMGVVVAWNPVYRLDGVIKAVTALASLTTFGMLVPMLPLLVQLPSPTQLAQANAALGKEVEERKQAEEEVRRTNAHLEDRIAVRTAELRNSNEQLRDTMDRYRFLAEAMPGIIWTTRPDGAAEYFNQRWYEYTGQTVSESLDWGWRAVVHPDDLNRCIERWRDAVQTGTAYEVEYRFRRAKDGEYRWHLGRGVPRFSNQGEIVQWVGSCTDIDDQKRAAEALQDANAMLRAEIQKRKGVEEQLVQAQKIEAIGRLAGGVAHDFNNLLTAILGYTQLLKEEGTCGAPALEYVAEVQAAAERASGLTKQLLAFSRRQIIQPRTLDLNQTIVNVEKMLRRIIGEDIDLSLRLAPDLGYVKADPAQIDQVVLNIAVNARDAMPGGGKLTIETASVDLGEEYASRHFGAQPGRYVMLAISDTGIGMDAETRRMLFEPFFTTKPPGKGTGLGLSMVYGIVKQNGGDIQVYSEPGMGSTFKIYLPVVDAPAEDRAVVQGATRTTPTETILLVEDEEQVRRMTKRLLTKSGYTVLDTPSPTEALRIAQEQRDRIDLLLTDVVMPEMSGKQLASAVNDLSPNTKVLFMSGYTDAGILCHGVLEPGTAFIQKPFTGTTLHDKIRQILGGRERDKNGIEDLPE